MPLYTAAWQVQLRSPLTARASQASGGPIIADLTAWFRSCIEQWKTREGTLQGIEELFASEIAVLKRRSRPDRTLSRNNNGPGQTWSNMEVPGRVQYEC